MYCDNKSIAYLLSTSQSIVPYILLIVMCILNKQWTCYHSTWFLVGERFGITNFMYHSQCCAMNQNGLVSSESLWFPCSCCSVEYWFRCMDLDGDGIISMYEMEYFYEEQVQKMEMLGIETLPFQDCLCQVILHLCLSWLSQQSGLGRVGKLCDPM